jgi:hypothetical protein
MSERSERTMSTGVVEAANAETLTGAPHEPPTSTARDAEVRHQ